MRMLTFSSRTAKEILRDPLTAAFGAGFPLVLLLLLSAIQANIPVSLFEISHLAPGIAVFSLSFLTLFSATLISRDRTTALLERLKAAGVRAKMDDSDQSMGWKAAEYEMKGVPLRLELGPKDIEQNQCVLVRRDSAEKIFVSLDGIEKTVQETLQAVHDGLFAKAKKNLDEHCYPAFSLEEAKTIQAERGGFIKTMWCGDVECEEKMKEVAGMSSRCIPFAQEHLADTCPICGKPAKHMVYWGVAY